MRRRRNKIRDRTETRLFVSRCRSNEDDGKGVSDDNCVNDEDVYNYDSLHKVVVCATRCHDNKADDNVNYHDNVNDTYNVNDDDNGAKVDGDVNDVDDNHNGEFDDDIHDDNTASGASLKMLL